MLEILHNHIRAFRAFAFCASMANRARLNETTAQVLGKGVNVEALSLIEQNPAAAILAAKQGDAKHWKRAKLRKAQTPFETRMLAEAVARVKANEDIIRRGGRTTLHLSQEGI